MLHKDKLIAQVLLTAKKAGLLDITPIVLSDGGNLIIHLSPHPIVARIATVISEENPDKTNKLLDRELRVAWHLHNKGVPVLLPTDLIDAGPHEVDGIWMTFWNYISPTQLQPLTPREAVQLVNMLSVAMKSFSDELPLLGIWDRVCRSAIGLSKNSDSRIKSLLEMFQRVDWQMRMIEPKLMIPAHGDAHARNLFPSPEGWVWMDFEDVSLMPAYWDLASFVSNFALFKGFQEPILRYMLDHTDIVTDPKAFGFALTSRTLMSVIGNLDLALKGHGDLAFATRQLELVEDFLFQVHLIV